MSFLKGLVPLLSRPTAAWLIKKTNKPPPPKLSFTNAFCYFSPEHKVKNCHSQFEKLVPPKKAKASRSREKIAFLKVPTNHFPMLLVFQKPTHSRRKESHAPKDN